MNELIDKLPESDKLLADSKKAIIKDIETERVVDDAVIFSYLAAKRLGIDYDVRKKTYETVNQLSFDDIKKFNQKELAKKPYTYCIVASEKKINTDELKKYGEVKKLTLEEIFGY
jgi:hypothetical protein